MARGIGLAGNFLLPLLAGLFLCSCGDEAKTYAVRIQVTKSDWGTEALTTTRARWKLTPTSDDFVELRILTTPWAYPCERVKRFVLECNFVKWFDGPALYSAHVFASITTIDGATSIFGSGRTWLNWEGRPVVEEFKFSGDEE